MLLLFLLHQFLEEYLPYSCCYFAFIALPRVLELFHWLGIPSLKGMAENWGICVLLPAPFGF